MCKKKIADLLLTYLPNHRIITQTYRDRVIFHINKLKKILHVFWQKIREPTWASPHNPRPHKVGCRICSFQEVTFTYGRLQNPYANLCVFTCRLTHLPFIGEEKTTLCLFLSDNSFVYSNILQITSAVNIIGYHYNIIGIM